MIRKYIPRITVIILCILIILGAVNAVAASNTVSSSRLQEQNTALTANNKKPVECKNLTLTAIVTCPVAGGACSGTVASELIIGSVYDDVIRGKGGTDCILGGAGNDELRGGGAGDICVGGDGFDTFPAGCETKIQ